MRVPYEGPFSSSGHHPRRGGHRGTDEAREDRDRCGRRGRGDAVRDPRVHRATPRPDPGHRQRRDRPSGAVPRSRARVRGGGKEASTRPVLAVKIENAPESRPQAGLEHAEVVFEEPVEGGLTRFIALYQCRSATRLGPVRIARLTDPDALEPFGRPLFGYAGGAIPVKEAIESSDLVDLSYLVADAYERDESRSAPHNLYSSTGALRRSAHGRGEPTPEVFAFSETFDGKSRRARVAHLPFSNASDVYWTWSRRSDAWLRSHGSEPTCRSRGRADHRRHRGRDARAGRAGDDPGRRRQPVSRRDAHGKRQGVDPAGRPRRSGAMGATDALADPPRFLTKDGEEIPTTAGDDLDRAAPRPTSRRRSRLASEVVTPRRSRGSGAGDGGPVVARSRTGRACRASAGPAE